MKLVFLALSIFVIASSADAACPAKAPKVKKSNLVSGDQKVNAAWLQKNLAGRKVVYPGNLVETYKPDGSYSFKADGQVWAASAYKFYENGMRCIGYEQPRFDLYVVNNGQLILVNEQKQRYVGKIRK